MSAPLLTVPLKSIIQKLLNAVTADIPAKENFSPVKYHLILPKTLHRLEFKISSISDTDNRMLSVTITPSDRSLIHTRYILRGSSKELKEYLTKTTSSDWEALIEELTGECKTFYYP